MALFLGGCPVWGSSGEGSSRTEPAPQLDAGPPTTPRGDGDACVADADCGPGGACIDDVCTYTDTCSADDDCNEGMICDFRGTCVEPGENSCRDNSECDGGELCVEGQCRGEDEVCQFNYECGAGRACINSTCVPICGSDDDCGSGQTCAGGFCTATQECGDSLTCGEGESCVEERCLEQCGEGDPCSNAADICEEGFCRPDWAPHSVCAEDEDCADGHVCNEGYCRTPCASGLDTECQGFDFQLTTCGEDNLCYTDNEASPECLTGDDCTDEGDACIDGICR